MAVGTEVAASPQATNKAIINTMAKDMITVVRMNTSPFGNWDFTSRAAGRG